MLALSGIGDLSIQYDRQDWRGLRTEWRELDDVMRLLDDLGWEEWDGRDVYELTMPDEQLERVVAYHRQRVIGSLGDIDFWHPRDGKRLADELLDALSACDAVLAGEGR